MNASVCRTKSPRPRARWDFAGGLPFRRNGLNQEGNEIFSQKTLKSWAGQAISLVNVQSIEFPDKGLERPHRCWNADLILP